MVWNRADHIRYFANCPWLEDGLPVRRDSWLRTMVIVTPSPSKSPVNDINGQKIGGDTVSTYMSWDGSSKYITEMRPPNTLKWGPKLDPEKVIHIQI